MPRTEKKKTVTQQRGESPAECCRRMGWKVGTKIAGDEGRGPETILITAIGEHSILARPLTYYPTPGRWCEGLWTLEFRDWKEVPS